MPIFDATLTLEFPRVTVIEAIRRIMDPHEQVIALREAPVLLSLRQDVGYVYVIASKDGVSCKLRLIVDKVSKVRDAFREHSPRVAVTALAQTPNIASSDTRLEAAARLEAIRNEVRQTPLPGASGSSAHSADFETEPVDRVPAAPWSFVVRLLRNPQ
jgi:hypothetical protein